MTSFAQLRQPIKGPLKPPRVVELPPSAWADREDKPLAPVPIGIKLISETDIQVCKARAAQAVAEFARDGTEEDQVSAYNDALMVVAIEKAACTPTDATDAYFLMGEHDVRARLTTDGIRRLWQELNLLFIVSNPSMPEIDEEGLAHLVAMLGRGIWGDYVARSERRQILQLFEYCRRALADGEETAEAAGVPIVEPRATGAAATLLNERQVALAEKLQRQLAGQ